MRSFVMFSNKCLSLSSGLHPMSFLSYILTSQPPLQSIQYASPRHFQFSLHVVKAMEYTYSHHFRDALSIPSLLLNYCEHNANSGPTEQLKKTKEYCESKVKNRPYYVLMLTGTYYYFSEAHI